MTDRLLSLFLWLSLIGYYRYCILVLQDVTGECVQTCILIGSLVRHIANYKIIVATFS